MKEKKIATVLYALCLIGLILLGAYIKNLPGFVAIVCVVLLFVLLALGVGYTVKAKKMIDGEKE